MSICIKAITVQCSSTPYVAPMKGNIRHLLDPHDRLHKDADNFLRSYFYSRLYPIIPVNWSRDIEQGEQVYSGQ